MHVSMCKTDSGKYSLVLCDDLEGWDGRAESRREVQEGRNICILWLVHIVVWQKPTQYYTVIILQFKKFLINKNKKHLKRISVEGI